MTTKSKFQQYFSSGRNFDPMHELLGGKWRCGWLKHCAVSWKVVGSITDGAIGIFL